ncbi:MAG: glycosyl transferase family protein [uncultured bacterium]|uniref:Glycosyltransferase 2-like domain-containing protein n=3 Tax=Candidatus Daviesiibacteriota TaxID=1752718 RepID=A0A1F5K6G3_9BACT|nr:MAG: glycosyl transferase family protein [uncultured bacterium]KKQ81049.1 MAG: Glycosyl transferase, family 2 [Candidatus Daviesbacteria bacterium GW2011_GWA1_38_7]OGE17468.1 MAG: hypothetical protein A2858_00990 [Candidatus Daviesbacteria bacterium RIFCSPHIGHO2_01_FULL_36_37]OGE36563.1 MAG: hypothetical protein A3E66_02835 [Candidatus Daviesbacteria bacterium RIFCSPHIGHO2_12_FULL_37_16]
MNVSIVIPNWNGEERLRRNLPKVLEVGDVDEIIVVDDGSTDGSVQLLEREFPKVKLIKKQKNSGFSSTVNLGVKEAKGELIFLLNSDAVPARDCLKFILPHFKDPRVFSVGLNNGGSWSWAKFEDGYFWHYQSKEKTPKIHQTLWVSGGSGVFRKDIWEKLGGLDELFDPFYEEDLDLGYRATKRGYINLWEPKAIVEHGKTKGVIEENFSKSSVSAIAQRNQLLFIWKNITDEDLFMQHKISLIKKLLISPKYWSVLISALGKMGKLRSKRLREIKDEAISDKEILKKFKD